MFSAFQDTEFGSSGPSLAARLLRTRIREAQAKISHVMSANIANGSTTISN